MSIISALLLPGLSLVGIETRASSPVWANSTTRQIRFQAMPRKVAVRLWHRARDFDRSTRRAGRHGGAIGPTALQVLHSLIFDFLNHQTGRLDPSYAALAKKANISIRSVASAVKRLRDLGILAWVRRCREDRADGQIRLRQETNAYAVQQESHWRGYRPPPSPPAPDAGTWGDHPPLPSPIAQAVLEAGFGTGLRGMVAALSSDPNDFLARALARLGQAMESRKTQ